MTDETPEAQTEPKVIDTSQVKPVLPKLHFHLREDLINTLEWSEYEALERAQDGDLKLYQIRPLLARFMANEDNTSMDHVQAMRVLAKIPMVQVPDVIKSFMDALKDKTVPKENGG